MSEHPDGSQEGAHIAKPRATSVEHKTRRTKPLAPAARIQDGTADQRDPQGHHAYTSQDRERKAGTTRLWTGSHPIRDNHEGPRESAKPKGSTRQTAGSGSPETGLSQQTGQTKVRDGHRVAHD